MQNAPNRPWTKSIINHVWLSDRCDALAAWRRALAKSGGKPVIRDRFRETESEPPGTPDGGVGGNPCFWRVRSRKLAKGAGSGGPQETAPENEDQPRLSFAAVQETAMQSQGSQLSHGDHRGFLTPHMPLRSFGADPGRRIAYIRHWRARASGSRPAGLATPSALACASENLKHGKQDADRCGASGRDPGRRGKGQSRRGI